MVRSITWIEKFPPKLENTELNCVFPGKRVEIQIILDTFQSLVSQPSKLNYQTTRRSMYDLGLPEHRSRELRFV